MPEALFHVAPPTPRAAIERAIESLIDLLDLIDGDPDAEEVDLEDSFGFSGNAQRLIADLWNGPGCPLMDPGGGNVEDEPQLEDGHSHPAYGVDQSLGPDNVGPTIRESYQRFAWRT